MTLRFEEVAEILKAIDSSSCDELVVETGDLKLVVRRNGAAGAAPAMREPGAQAPVAPAAAPVAPSPATAPASSSNIKPDQIVIAAPMVGTFYRAPSPDASPFVEIGSVVHKGDPVCLIEVMKLFTTINSDVDGRVVQIGAENGELVEFAQPLFILEPI